MWIELLWSKSIAVRSVCWPMSASAVDPPDAAVVTNGRDAPERGSALTLAKLRWVPKVWPKTSQLLAIA